MNRREGDAGACCGVALLKYSLFIYTTLVYLLCACCVLAFCVYVYIAQWDYAWALASRVYPAVVLVLAASALLSIAVALLACIGSLAESRRFLLWFIIPVAIVFVLQLGCGIVAAVYSANVRGITGSSLGDMIRDQYGLDDDFTDSIDRLQAQERCCGAGDFLREYADTVGEWKRPVGKADVGELVPESCCRSRTPMCGRRAHPSNVFTLGCAEPLSSRTAGVTLVLSLVSFAAAALQLVAMSLSCWLYARIADREQHKRRAATAYYYDE